jgi:hypothetical protein
MADRKKIVSVVTSKVKSLDPESIVQGTFYDDASGRVVVTIIKGTRKTLASLPGWWFENGSGSDRVGKAIERALKQLDRSPVG